MNKISEIEKLRQTFNETGVVNFNIFRDTNPNTTPEQLAKTINEVIHNLGRGNFDVLVDEDDNQPS